MPDEQQAESLTAETEVQEKPMESWSPEERSTWLEKGEVPKPNTEESAASTPDKSAADSGAAKETQDSKKTEEKPKQDAETRKKQLGGEIQDLLETRRRLREEVSQLQAPRPGPQPGREIKGQERPQRPKLDQFDSYDKYEEALDQYTEKVADWKVEQRFASERSNFAQRQQHDEIARQNEQIKSGWTKREGETVKRHPDFHDVVKGAGDLPLNPIMDSFILNSEIGPELVYHLAGNAEEAARIAGLDPFHTSRELTRLEDKLLDGIKNPARKTITGAKQPPTELSGTNKAPEDEAEAALAAGDFRAYKDSMNRRDVARLVRK